MSPDKAQAPVQAHQEEYSPQFVVLNMGRQRRKKVKQLKRGEGRLVEVVADSLAELKREGTIAEVPQLVVVVVVKEKENRKRVSLPFIGSL